MLIPRFTLRWLLLAVAGCAVLFFVLALATRERLWAVALAVPIVALAVVLALHAALFLALWLYSRAEDLWRQRRRAQLAARNER